MFFFELLWCLKLEGSKFIHLFTPLLYENFLSLCFHEHEIIVLALYMIALNV